MEIPEIDLHPEYVDYEDAEDVLKDFIRRNASKKGVKKIKIIHGYGNGSMERLVRRVIEDEGYVPSDYHYDWNNWGATILHLH